MTSNHTTPSGRSGYVRELHTLLAGGIVPAAERDRGVKPPGAVDAPGSLSLGVFEMPGRG
jgi:hypothetical protein